jgi:hypothetical protein
VWIACDPCTHKTHWDHSNRVREFPLPWLPFLWLESFISNYKHSMCERTQNNKTGPRKIILVESKAEKRKMHANVNTEAGGRSRYQVILLSMTSVRCTLHCPGEVSGLLDQPLGWGLGDFIVPSVWYALCLKIVRLRTHTTKRFRNYGNFICVMIVVRILRMLG